MKNLKVLPFKSKLSCTNKNVYRENTVNRYPNQVLLVKYTTSLQ